MLRVIVVAGALAALVPALRHPLEWYCAAVAVCLLITGWHLPTDITGGVLAGVALFFAAQLAGAPATRRVSSSSSPRTATPVPDPARTSGSR